MNPLLEWGLKHSDPTKLQQTMAAGSNLLKEDRELIDTLLKSDVERMEEELKKLGPELELEVREEALDSLECLVESIDNANDLIKIKGVAPVLSLLDDPETSIQLGALWVLGTCCQNNPHFSEHLVDLNGMEVFVKLLQQSTDIPVLNKLIYALSGCIRSCAIAADRFAKLEGFIPLCSLLANTQDLNLKRKIVFFLGSLIGERHEQEFVLRALRDEKVYDEMLSQLQIDDLDLREKILETYEAAVTHDHEAKNYFVASSLLQSLQAWMSTNYPQTNTSDDSKTLNEYYSRILQKFTKK